MWWVIKFTLAVLVSGMTNTIFGVSVHRQLTGERKTQKKLCQVFRICVDSCGVIVAVVVVVNGRVQLSMLILFFFFHEFIDDDLQKWNNSNKIICVSGH